MRQRRLRSLRVRTRSRDLNLWLAGFAVAIAMLAAIPCIATDTWDNGAGSGLWSGTNNWADNTEPTSTDDVVFPTPIPLGDSTIALSSGELAASITLNDNYSLGGGTLLSLAPGVSSAWLAESPPRSPAA